MNGATLKVGPFQIVTIEPLKFWCTESLHDVSLCPSLSALLELFLNIFIYYVPTCCSFCHKYLLPLSISLPLPLSALSVFTSPPAPSDSASISLSSWRWSSLEDGDNDQTSGRVSRLFSYIPLSSKDEESGTRGSRGTEGNPSSYSRLNYMK